jgi:hypothetical protein
VSGPAAEMLGTPSAEELALRRILLTLPEAPGTLDVLEVARVYLKTRCHGIEASIVLRLIERAIAREEKR